MTARAVVAAGFYGKLPARGDFVRSGLPRDFTDAWDGWLAPAISGSRASLGDAWLAAFLEAPVWRFRLPPGLCGGCAALGLMLPSVDRVGRYFPLTFAALFAAGAPLDTAWLDRCEAAGFAALEQDLGPGGVAAMVGVPDASPNAGEAATGESVWWTGGGPRVPATRFALSGLPNAAVYATMLDAAAAGTIAPTITARETTMQAADMQPTRAVQEGAKPWKPPP